jgi:Urm1 (Ubiquitin related modifier)
MNIAGQSISMPTIVSGGLELLFDGHRKLEISIPAHTSSGESSDINFLVDYLCKNVMTDKRTDMFVMNGTVSVSSYVFCCLQY